jgi:hypothetical protein
VHSARPHLPQSGRRHRRLPGLCDQQATVPADLGDLPADPLERIIHVASWIDQGRHPYCWGGGHATTPGPSTGSYCWTSAGAKAFGTSEKGLDCSGAVRWLLILAGYQDPGGITSGSFDDVYPRGQGRVLTIWSNANHVFIHIRGKGFWGTTQLSSRTGMDRQLPNRRVRSKPSAGAVKQHKQDSRLSDSDRRVLGFAWQQPRSTSRSREYPLVAHLSYKARQPPSRPQRQVLAPRCEHPRKRGRTTTPSIARTAPAHRALTTA